MARFSQSNNDLPDQTGDSLGHDAAHPPSSARPRGVGVLLRETRESIGCDLNQAGATLRIRVVYLQAIEDGRYDRLPGSVYAVGFIRSYAEFLGLDGLEIVRRFKQETEGLVLKRDLSFPMPLTEHSVPGGTILLLAFILAICGYGIWYYVSSSERPRSERVTAVPQAMLPPAPQMTADATGPVNSGNPIQAEAAASSLPPPAPSGPVPSGPLAVSPASPAPAAVEPPAINPPVPQAAPITSPPPAQTASLPAAGAGAIASVDPAHLFGATDGTSRIAIKASADSWLQVRDALNAQVFQRVMRSGDTYLVPNKPGLTMWVGNAGGLEITVDGHAVPALGGVGIVHRNVLLDPQRLIAGTAATD